MNITLKRIQIYPRMSQETTAFNADVYLDDVKVGEASNEGHGGCNMYHWKDRATGDKIEKWAKDNDPEGYDPLDSVLDTHLIKFEEEKQYRRWCKTKICFRLKGDKDGTWRTYPFVYIQDKHKPQLQTKYGDKLKEILNDRFV